MLHGKNIIFVFMEKSQKEGLGEIRITGIRPQLSEELTNISKNMGVKLTSLLKPIIQDYANKQPAHLKMPPKDKD